MASGLAPTRLTMPSKPLKHCSVPGCAERVLAGKCERHRAEAQKRFDETRGTAAQRGYGHRWRARRARYLAINPRCVGWSRPCGEPATVADHIKPRRQLLAEGVVNPDQEQYLQPMCASCHGRKTAHQDGGFGHRPAAA